jgi:hypothetical protein
MFGGLTKKYYVRNHEGAGYKFHRIQLTYLQILKHFGGHFSKTGFNIFLYCCCSVDGNINLDWKAGETVDDRGWA